MFKPTTVVLALLLVSCMGKPVPDACDDASDWHRGQATYYAADEAGGNVGSHDNELVDGVSVAVKESWSDRVGSWVCIRGLQTASKGSELRRVDDLCAGDGCKEFDIYQGDEMGGDEGVDDIEWSWI